VGLLAQESAMQLPPYCQHHQSIVSSYAARLDTPNEIAARRSEFTYILEDRPDAILLTPTLSAVHVRRYGKQLRELGITAPSIQHQLGALP